MYRDYTERTFLQEREILDRGFRAGESQCTFLLMLLINFFFFLTESNLFVNKEFPSKKKGNPTTYRCWEEIQEALEPRGGPWGSWESLPGGNEF